MMNGTTVYKISMGRLYLTCCGTRSPRLRWKITVHKIPPQTSKPDADRRDPRALPEVDDQLGLGGQRIAQPEVVDPRGVAAGRDQSQREEPQQCAAASAESAEPVPRGAGPRAAGTRHLGTVVGTHRWPSQQLSPGFSGRLSSTSYSLSWKTVQRPGRTAGVPPASATIRYPCRRAAALAPGAYSRERGVFRRGLRRAAAPERREALLAALDDGWADPARLHREGRRAQLLLDRAREAVAAEIGCRPDELSFTSFRHPGRAPGRPGTVQARQSAARGPGHLVASAVEHSSVLNAADWLARRTGTAVTITGVDRLGRADVAEFAAAVSAGAHAAGLLAVRQSRSGYAPARGRGGGRLPGRWRSPHG